MSSMSSMPALPEKAAVRDALVAHLEEAIAKAAARAEQSRRDATHEEARAENDKDTRGLETSYLARGQAMRVEELAESVERARRMVVRALGEDDAVAVGALVRLVDPDAEDEAAEAANARVFFLVPIAGGTTLDVGGQRVLVVTPQSPVGQALVGRFEGDEVSVRVGGNAPRTYEIDAVR